MVRLPKDGAHWEARECDLWFRTGGHFHPRKSVGEHRPPSSLEAQRFSGGPFGLSGREGRVSVVVPTTEGRQKFHEKLWACFNAQTWPDKELVVVETYESESSEFLLAKAKVDRRLTYVRYKVFQEDDWSIGLKRNLCANLATGQYLAHFDDDDLYAPTYLDTMIENVRKCGTLAIKLSRWYVLDIEENRFYYCDPLAFEHEATDAEQWILSQYTTLSTLGLAKDGEKTYGWGFSYVYLRSVVLEFPFEDKNMGEDWGFYSAVMRAKGCHSIALLEDTTGICLHLQHGRNTSKSLCVASREVLAGEVQDLEVADLQALFPARPRQGPSEDCGQHAEGAASAGRRAEARPRRPLQDEQPAAPSRQFRRVVVHCPGRTVEFGCARGAKAKELPGLLEGEVGLIAFAEVYRVPALGEAVSDAALQEYLRAALRMVAPGLTLPPAAATEPWKQFQGELQSALARARGAVPRDERLGGCISEFWVLAPALRSESTVRVVCQATPADPHGFKVFHIDLTLDATVAELREALGAGLPADAMVLAEKTGRGLVILHDGEIVPSVVTISVYTEPVQLRMVFTKRISRMIQVLMKKRVAQESTQRQIAEFEATAGDKRQVFRVLLSNFLNKEVYPQLTEPFGLQDMLQGMRFMEAYHAANHEMGLIFSESFVEAWMELDELMRNWEAKPYATHKLGLATQQKAAEDRALREWAQVLSTSVAQLPALPAAKEHETGTLLELRDPTAPGCRQRWHVGLLARRLTCAFWLQVTPGQVPEGWVGPICETTSGKDLAGLFSVALDGQAWSARLRVSLFGNIAATTADDRYTGGGPSLEFQEDFADGAFHHVAVLYDSVAATCELLVDGGASSEGLRFERAQPVRVTDVVVAARSPHLPPEKFQRWPRGRLRDVRIWARCLAEEEVARLYHASKHCLPAERGPARS